MTSVTSGIDWGTPASIQDAFLATNRNPGLKSGAGLRDAFSIGGAGATKGFRRVRQLLIPEQRPDGSWEPASQMERDAGSVYATSLATLALCVKNHYLPIYQR